MARARVYVRPLDTLAGRPLPGTENATFPFWSPEGDAVGFFAEGKLRTVALSDGSVREVCDAPNGRGGSWNRHGTIVFAPDREGSLLSGAGRWRLCHAGDDGGASRLSGDTCGRNSCPMAITSSI